MIDRTSDQASTRPFRHPDYLPSGAGLCAPNRALCVVHRGAMATLHGLFEQQVPKAPSKVAVQWREASLSYAELDRCADAMAGRLCREGARRGEIVGLMLDRSLEMVVAIIGCLKSGAAYVTLLPTWPAQQRLEILREAESRILILQSSFHEDLAAFDGAKLTFDDCTLSEPSTSRVPVEATDLAYIIYTSGSTGKPKGVMMHHGGTANNIACNAHLSCSAASRCCFSNKYTFDVHVADIFKPLSVGATVVVTRDIFRIPPVDVVSTLPNKIAMAKACSLVNKSFLLVRLGTCIQSFLLLGATRQLF